MKEDCDSYSKGLASLWVPLGMCKGSINKMLGFIKLAFGIIFGSVKQVNNGCHNFTVYVYL